MRFLRSMSKGVIVLLGVLVFSLMCVLCLGVMHMDRADPRELMLEKVIGNGAILIGIIFVVIRSDTSASASQRVEETSQRVEHKLEDNTLKTVETKEKVELVAEQTNGGLTRRMQQIVDENIGKFATKEEMKKMVAEAAQIAVRRASRKRPRRR
jgi:hypothetical protein